MEFVLFFGLGVLGILTLYLNVRYSRTIGQAIFFVLCGIILLTAQCLLIKFFASFGRAFGGENVSGFVIVSVAFSMLVTAGFIVVTINKFSNGKE